MQNRKTKGEIKGKLKKLRGRYAIERGEEREKLDIEYKMANLANKYKIT